MLILLKLSTSRKCENKYHLIRAGTSELEHAGIYSTNPLFLTNRENQMHDGQGTSLIKKALEKLPSHQLPTVVYHSLAANGMDTGDLIARELKLGRDRLLPEFTYLDQRGIGLWDSSDMSIVKPALWALDEMEAGPEGFGARPPANEDGTPNETLHDQFIRLRQFISLQESRTSGETILIIFPDGTGPALMSAMIAGIPFNKVHVLEMVPGELRLDVTPESIKAMYEQRKDDPDYLATIEDGKEKLAKLRQKQKDGTLQEWISLKDSIAEEERQDLDRQLQERKAAEEARAAERKRQEKAKAQAMAQQAKQKAEEDRHLQEEAKRQKERERQELANQRQADRAAAAISTRNANRDSATSSSSSSMSFGTLAGTAGLGLLGLGALAIGTSGNDNPETVTSAKASATKLSSNITDAMDTSTGIVGVNASIPEDVTSEAAPSPSKSLEDGDKLMNDVLQTLMAKELAEGETSRQDDTATAESASTNPDATSIEQQFDAQMERAEQQLKDALKEAAEVQEQKKQKRKALYDNDVATSNASTETETDPYLPNYSDDGANDWLKVLVQIRDEDDDDMFGDDISYPTEGVLVVNGEQNGSSGDILPNSTMSRDI
jgi:hypothetical protein